MTIVQLQYFLRLAETCSFRKTAEYYFISQPAVSKQISLLESEWDVRLFNRSYKKVTLTESGQHIYECLAKCKKSLFDTISQEQIRTHKKRTRIRVGIPERTFLGNFFSLISQFQESHPEIIVTVESTAADQLTLDYPDGHFDIIINHSPVIPDSAHIRQIKLTTLEHMLVVSKKVSDKLAVDNDLSLLSGKRFYLQGGPENNAAESELYKITSSYGFTPGEIVYLKNLDSLLIAVDNNPNSATLLDDSIMLYEENRLTMLPTKSYVDLILAYDDRMSNPNILRLVELIGKNIEYPSEYEKLRSM